MVKRLLVAAGATAALAGCGTTANSGCNGHPCIGTCEAEMAKGGTVVQYDDGAWSHAGGIRGACSGHGGEKGSGSWGTSDLSGGWGSSWQMREVGVGVTCRNDGLNWPHCDGADSS